MRRLLAAALAALTVGGTTYLALARPDPEAVPALVAVRALPVGHVLTDQDVQVRDLPGTMLPDGALTQAPAALDRRVVAPLARGEVLTDLDLRTAGLLTGADAELLAVFLPLGEPAVAEAVGAADVVDVHSPLDGSVVVRRALVLGTGTGERPGLWLGVDAVGARAVASARGADPAGAALQVTLHP